MADTKHFLKTTIRLLPVLIQRLTATDGDVFCHGHGHGQHLWQVEPENSNAVSYVLPLQPLAVVLTCHRPRGKRIGQANRNTPRLERVIPSDKFGPSQKDQDDRLWISTGRCWSKNSAVPGSSTAVEDRIFQVVLPCLGMSAKGKSPRIQNHKPHRRYNLVVSIWNRN